MSDDFPFGKHSKGASDPDLEQLKQAFNRYKNYIYLAIAVLLAVLVGFMSFYIVDTNSVGIVTRFGSYNREEPSGPHFKIPFMETVYAVPTKKQQKAEFGFSTAEAGQNSSYVRTDDDASESLMLTGDLNVAIVEWIVHYQITNPKKYLFFVRDPEETLRDLSEATMREIVGDYSVTEVLTSGREEILQKAKLRLDKLCQNYETGISVQRIELKDSAPPHPVKPSFNEVNQAEQERDRKQNEALAQYNKEIPRAKGEAKQLLEEAQGYAIERINRAKGDVAKFAALQSEYAKYPDVTRTRIYLETLNEILGNVEKKMIIDEKLKGVMPMLMPVNNGAAPVTMPRATGGVQ